MRNLIALIRDEKGATAIEYGLIAALIGIAAIGAMSQLGQTLNNTFSMVAANLSNANR